MTIAPLFRDRAAAGRALARKLLELRVRSPIVVALPRGGVPVAAEIAYALRAPLEVCVVRKLGLPGREELGMGAVAEGGHTFVDPDIVRRAHLAPGDLARLVSTKLGEIGVRARRLRGNAPPLDVDGRTVIVVDDGLATGGTARAALLALRARGARELVLAVPVADAAALAALASECDDVVCVAEEEDLGAVGCAYVDFSQVPEEDVIALLERNRRASRDARRDLAS